MLSGRSKIVRACVITCIVTFVLTVGGMYVFNVGIGDKVFVSQSEYNKVKKLVARYAPVEETKQFLESKYYEELDEKTLIEGMCKGMYESIGDPYTRYMTREEYQNLLDGYSGEFDGIGVVMRLTLAGYASIVSVVEDSPAQKAGIRTGDEIVGINGESYVGRKLSDFSSGLRGKEGTKVSLIISRGGELQEYELTREAIPNITVRGTIYDNNIGYIRITSFKRNTAEEFKAELRRMERNNVDGLVIDLRANGGGIIDDCIEIADMLMNGGTVVTSRKGDGTEYAYSTKDGRTLLDYVILVDGGTASASEILSIGVKGNHEGTIVGTQTYGKGITQGSWKANNGGGVQITISQYFGPNGEVIHKKGITPDVIVEFQEEDFSDGYIVYDRQLEKAFEILKER